MSLEHEQEYDRRCAAIDTNDRRAKQATEADFDRAALITRTSTAPPMRETHLEVRRRCLERAVAALAQAQEEADKAQASLDELQPKPAAQSDALTQRVEQLPTAKTEWKVGTAALKTTMPHLDFADRALDTQVGGAHYKKMAIQPVEFIDKNGIPYLEGNAIKYICRHAEKGGVQDIDKAIHYLQLLKELRYGDSK